MSDTRTQSTVPDQPHLFISGGPVEGFTYEGPFPNAHAAADYGYRTGGGDLDWWIAPLVVPTDENGEPLK